MGAFCWTVLAPGIGVSSGASPSGLRRSHHFSGVAIGGPVCDPVRSNATKPITDHDLGPPIAQVALGSAHGQINEKLTDLMFRAGCIALYTALLALNDASLVLAQAKALQAKEATFLVSPSCQLPNALANEAFWDALKS